MESNCVIYGVQSAGCPSMKKSLHNNCITEIKNYDTFVDGASVKQPGNLTFDICNEYKPHIELINNNHLCNTLIKLYQEDGIIVEPSGALSIACLDNIKDKITNKNVVCIISGGNNDIMRYSDFIEKSLTYDNLVHYFIINFPQRPGSLKNFVNTILSDNIDIIRFEYLKKSNKNYGSVLLGLQLDKKEDIYNLLDKLENSIYQFKIIKPDDPLYSFII